MPLTRRPCDGADIEDAHVTKQRIPCLYYGLALTTVKGPHAKTRRYLSNSSSTTTVQVPPGLVVVVKFLPRHGGPAPVSVEREVTAPTPDFDRQEPSDPLLHLQIRLRHPPSPSIALLPSSQALTLAHSIAHG